MAQAGINPAFAGITEEFSAKLIMTGASASCLGDLGLGDLRVLMRCLVGKVCMKQDHNEYNMDEI